MVPKTPDTELELYRQPLFEAIERTFGRKVQTSRDFTQLRTDIGYRTTQQIGTTTLKRIYGYVNDYTETRINTLNLLANYVGYPSWDAFKIASQTGHVRDSDLVTSRHLMSETLSVGTLIRLTWQPDRVCLCRYYGQNTFTVIRSEHTQLVAGSTFQCALFIAGQPAVLDHVIIAGSDKTIIYSIGTRSGIQYDVLTP